MSTRLTKAVLESRLMDKTKEIARLETYIATLRIELAEKNSHKALFANYAKTMMMCVEEFVAEGFTREEAVELSKFVLQQDEKRPRVRVNP